MPGKKKIGARVDEDVYEQFRQFVQDSHGRTRGVLSEELEQAMKERMASERQADRLQRIEDDVAHVKAMLAEADADGGQAIPSPPDSSDGVVHTHTEDAQDDADAVQSKPGSKAPRGEKARWVAQQVCQRTDGDQIYTRPGIRGIIDDQYGFDDRTAEPLVDLVIDTLGAEPDPLQPDDTPQLAWGDELKQRWEQRRDEQRQDAADAAADESAALDGAEQGDPMNDR